MTRRWDLFETGEPMPPDDAVATPSQVQAALTMPDYRDTVKQAIAEVKTAIYDSILAHKQRADTAEMHLAEAMALLEQAHSHPSLNDEEREDWRMRRLILTCLTTPMESTQLN